MNKDFAFWKKRVKEYGEKSVMDDNYKRGLYDDELRVFAFSQHKRIKRGMKILDAGCGSGNWSIRYAAIGCDVTGVDFMPELILIAKENAKKANVRVDFRVSAIEDFSAPKETYDLITSITVLQHITDEDRLKKTISNFHQMLKPTGEVLIMEYILRKVPVCQNAGYTIIRDRAGWLKLFEEAGFDLVKEKPVRILGFKLYNLCERDFILRVSLLIDKLLCLMPFVSIRYTDTRLLIFKKRKQNYA